MRWSCGSRTVHLIYWCSEDTSQLSRNTIAWSELVTNSASCPEITGKRERSSHSCPGKIFKWKETLYEMYGNLGYTEDAGCESLSFSSAVQLELGKKQSYDLQSSFCPLASFVTFSLRLSISLHMAINDRTWAHVFCWFHHFLLVLCHLNLMDGSCQDTCAAKHLC